VASHHVIDIAVVIITPPFAPQAWQNGRLFRLIRLLRVVRVAALRRLLSLEGMKYAAAVAVGTVIVGGAVFASVEERNKRGVITTWDGIWWAISTVTTVGYGDYFPGSTAGRINAITIMLVGIGFVALLTAFIADRFINVQAETEAKEDLILAELRRISARLDSLED
jgi:voltage-gated potassium channel